MSTPRADVAQLLTDSLPDDLVVLPYARQIDPPSKTTVMVRVDEVIPSREAPVSHRLYKYTLVILSRLTDPTGPAAWVQPLGAHDAYPLGAKVTHKGKTWTSTTAANIWPPGTGALWTDDGPV